MLETKRRSDPTIIHRFSKCRCFRRGRNKGHGATMMIFGRLLLLAWSDYSWNRCAVITVTGTLVASETRTPSCSLPPTIDPLQLRNPRKRHPLRGRVQPGGGRQRCARRGRGRGDSRGRATIRKSYGDGNGHHTPDQTRSPNPGVGQQVGAARLSPSAYMS